MALGPPLRRLVSVAVTSSEVRQSKTKVSGDSAANGLPRADARTNYKYTGLISCRRLVQVVGDNSRRHPQCRASAGCIAGVHEPVTKVLNMARRSVDQLIDGLHRGPPPLAFSSLHWSKVWFRCARVLCAEVSISRREPGIAETIELVPF